MKRETLIWSIVIVVAGIYLAIRAFLGAGSVYVQVHPIHYSVDGQEILWTEYTAVPPHVNEESNPPHVTWSPSRTFGIWLSAFFTLAIMSFLYRDNVFYRIAEAIFVGSSAAYAMVVGVWTVIVKELLAHLTPSLMRAWVLPAIPPEETPDYSYVVPLVLGIMLLWRLAPVGGWISRWPLALFIGVTAALQLVSLLETDFVRQIGNTMIPLVVFTAERQFDFVTSLKNITIVIGVLTCLTYFFFSIEHRGAVGGISRVGIWFLMITFGAGFANTVMGRIALLNERMQFLFGDWLGLLGSDVLPP